MNDPISDLIKTLLGFNIPTENKEEPKSSKPLGNETYQYPLKSFKIIGTFLPNQYVNENHKKGHDGVDLQAPRGTSLYPIAPGTVIETGNNPKGGNYIKTLHEDGKVVAYYAHLDSIDCQKGQSIDTNTVIGKVGNSGNASKTSSHLHLEIKINGTKVDPISIIGKTFKSASLILDISKASKLFYKLARTFEAPEEIKTDITNWALEVFSKQVWHRVDKIRTDAINKSDIAFDPENILENKKIAFRMKKIIEECQKYTDNPDETFNAQISFNTPLISVIPNWKYLNTNEMISPTIKDKLLNKGFEDTLKVIFYFDKDRIPKLELAAKDIENWSGIYSPAHQSFNPFIALSFNANITSSTKFKDAIEKIKYAVRHETQHLGQQVLQTIKELKRPAGIPGQKIREQSYTAVGLPKKENLPSLPYYLQDIEFQPNLQDAIETLIKFLPFEEDKQGFFKFFIGENLSYIPDSNIKSNFKSIQFIKALKENNSLKWQKAVKELYKAYKEKMYKLGMGEEIE